MRGRNRERLSIGKYGDVSLADARKEAMRLLSENLATLAPKPASKTFKDARTDFLIDHYKDSISRWQKNVEALLTRHFKAIEHMKLAEITDQHIRVQLDKLASSFTRIVPPERSSGGACVRRAGISCIPRWRDTPRPAKTAKAPASSRTTNSKPSGTQQGPALARSFAS